MNWSTASGRVEIEHHLRRIGGKTDDAIDLGKAALLLAALDRPRVPLERYFHHLKSLQEAVESRMETCDDKDSAAGRAAILGQVITEDFDYSGDQLTYDDLQNANLMRVIDRRKGLPVALGILYLATAQGLGWRLQGLNFPGHFLLRLEAAGERVILDPFHDGEICDIATLRRLLKASNGPNVELAPAHYETVDNRAILLRLQNNIKLRLLQQNKTEEAIEALESMLMLAPADSSLWHEIALLHIAIDNLRAAILALEHHLELGCDARGRQATSELLLQLKGRLN